MKFLIHETGGGDNLRAGSFRFSKDWLTSAYEHGERLIFTFSVRAMIMDLRWLAIMCEFMFVPEICATQQVGGPITSVNQDADSSLLMATTALWRSCPMGRPLLSHICSTSFLVSSATTNFCKLWHLF
ncbi:hypothetical protein R1flu_019526 [Riccia fluitans]|uniref:Uncharacterized protein n=1 Tax=Riccia fluitans TaxID=41844 RepID=A0ABD1ZIX9_9MARC